MKVPIAHASKALPIAIPIVVPKTAKTWESGSEVSKRIGGIYLKGDSGFRATRAMLRANRFGLRSFPSILPIKRDQPRFNQKMSWNRPGIPHVRLSRSVLGMCPRNESTPPLQRISITSKPAWVRR